MTKTTDPPDADGQDPGSPPTPRSTHERIKTALLEFAWHSYGLDAVEETLDDPDAQDWAFELADEIERALA